MLNFLHLMFLYSHKSNNIIMQNTTMSGDGKVVWLVELLRLSDRYVKVAKIKAIVIIIIIIISFHFIIKSFK